MNGNLAVIGILRDDPVVDELIDGRVAPLQSQQGKTFPQIFVENTDSEPYDSKSGTASMDLDLVSVFIEARTYADLKSVMEAARDCLDGYSGTVGNTTVQFIRYVNQSDYQERIEGIQTYGIEQQYEVRTINSVT